MALGKMGILDLFVLGVKTAALADLGEIVVLRAASAPFCVACAGVKEGESALKRLRPLLFIGLAWKGWYRAYESGSRTNVDAVAVFAVVGVGADATKSFLS
jgi:hypothetical protein